MDFEDVVRQLNQEIAEATDDLTAKETAARMANAHLSDLVTQRDTLVRVAERMGVEVPDATNDPLESEWKTMSRIDAVERVLRESGQALHLAQIENILRGFGRNGDAHPVISASLAHLKKTRGSVASTGGGTWAYVPETHRGSVNAAGGAQLAYPFPGSHGAVFKGEQLEGRPDGNGNMPTG